MSKGIITPGCLTNHGGMVQFKNPENGGSVVDGAAFSVQGDLVTCPVHGVVQLLSGGDPTFTINGKMVMMDGSLTSCGATVYAKQVRAVIGGSPMYEPSPLVFPEYIEHSHERKFLLQDEDGMPLPKTKYKAVINGKEIQGVSDESGHTQSFVAKEEHPIEFHIFKPKDKTDK